MGSLRRGLVAVAVAAGIALAAAAPALATDPASLFDAPGQSHANVCVHLTGASAALRFADSTADGFSLSNSLSFYTGECPDGTVRLDLHEEIPSAAGPLVFHRGGMGYFDDDNVKYGDLSLSDIADALPPPVPSSGGRGAPCQLSGEGAYRVDVQSIPSAMHYKRPQDVPSGSNSGSSFMHYGDPGADQGDRHDIHYTYLLWSFVDVQGGGTVRTLLAPGQTLWACDVQPITMSSWDSTGAVNGEVTARYVRALAGTCPMYGWMVWSHTYYPDGTGPVAHADPLATPPPPDPAPDPSCPAAEPPSPPVVATAPPTIAADGSLALAGTVNPKGVPSGYRFDYGPDPSYGSSSVTGGLGAADSDVPVTASLAGLQPGTTYHYRLVAWNTHGETDGADQTFVAPAAPASAGLTATPPAPPAPRLSSLRVRPHTFRRARRRNGTRTHIRFNLSENARVTLTFLRRTAGVRRGGKCRRAPHGRIPRHAHRCARWVEVRGSLHRSARAGSNSVSFGGWLGRRALASGRYRVRAVPVASGGVRGSTRLAGFALR